MEEVSTSSLSERERRKRKAEKTAAWRKRISGRPESRVVDRVALEALVLALADRTLVSDEGAAAILRRVADTSVAGLRRLGYEDGASRRALAVRLVEHGRHSKGSAVKPALIDLATSGRVRSVRRIQPGV